MLGAEWAPTVQALFQALLGRQAGQGDFEVLGGPDWQTRQFGPGSQDTLLQTIRTSPEYRNRFTVQGADPRTQTAAWFKGYLGRDLGDADIQALTPVYNKQGMSGVLDTILQSQEAQRRLADIKGRFAPPWDEMRRTSSGDW